MPQTLGRSKEIGGQTINEKRKGHSRDTSHYPFDHYQAKSTCNNIKHRYNQLVWSYAFDKSIFITIANGSFLLNHVKPS
jgi:hypothetical protein